MTAIKNLMHTQCPFTHIYPGPFCIFTLFLVKSTLLYIVLFNVLTGALGIRLTLGNMYYKFTYEVFI